MGGVNYLIFELFVLSANGNVSSLSLNGKLTRDEFDHKIRAGKKAGGKCVCLRDGGKGEQTLQIQFKTLI